MTSAYLRKRRPGSYYVCGELMELTDSSRYFRATSVYNRAAEIHSIKDVEQDDKG